MRKKIAALMLNGDYKDREFYTEKLKNYSYIVCADGASNNIYAMEITPNLLVGDFDSIDSDIFSFYKNKGVEILKFPPEKDYTDSQLALYELIERGYEEIHIYGSFGSRIDHTLGNIGLIYDGFEKNVSIILIDENTKIVGIKEGLNIINYESDKIFSILAFFGNIEGISIKNAKYTLENFDFRCGLPRGISNEFLNKDVEITIKSGKGICIITNSI